MTTPEERRLILRMIEQGKISADEGARLLTALHKSQADAPSPTPATGRGRTLQVRVTELGTNRQQVNVTLPAELVTLALRWLPPGAQREVAQVQAALHAGLYGKLAEVIDQEQGVRVEISLT
jgi:hypothetical protein